METLADLEAIKLLLLVANSVVLNDNAASEVAQELKLELATLDWDGRIEVLRVKNLAFAKNLFVLVHVVHKCGHIAIANLVNLFLENLSITSNLRAVTIVSDNQIVTETSEFLDIICNANISLRNLATELFSYMGFSHHDPSTSSNKLSEDLSLGCVLTTLGNDKVLN